MNHNSSVVYSVNHRLDGGGMGTSVTEMLIGLYKSGLLKQVIASSSKTERLPRQLITQMGFLGRIQKRASLYDPSGWCLNYLECRIFDYWASRVMQPGYIFSSWTGICASSLRKAKQNGSVTVLGLGSAHPRIVLNLLTEERHRWGLSPLRETPHLCQIEQELYLADEIIVQSEFSRRTLVERGLSPEKIMCLPLGVNIDRFHPADTPPSGPFRVLFLGQVMLRKGIQYLLEAWKQLNWQDAELWIVGKVMPDSRPVLKHYANLPGLKLQGYVPDQLAAFQQAHVFVKPYEEDGFGLTVVEAMACGLPVVVSNHTGAADLIQQGESGFVVTYNNVEEYTATLETLRSKPELARKMGRAARYIARQYTWDKYRENLVDFYLGLSAQCTL